MPARKTSAVMIRAIIVMGAAMDPVNGAVIAKTEGTQNEAHGIAFVVLWSPPQPLQSPWPELTISDSEAILSDDEAILAVMMLACTADKLKLRPTKSPRNKAITCRDDQQGMMPRECQ